MRLSRRAVILVAGAASALATHASAPQAGARATAAGCGGVETATARHSDGSLPPLAIGDSTMLLALSSLSREGFDVNAHGCRQYPEALSLLSDLARSGRLPHLVVINLGANGSVSPGDIGQALHILGPGRVLALLTPRELGGGSGSDAQLVRAEGRRHGTNLVVLDWVAYAAAHPSWFEPDGLHVNPTGAAAMSRLIASTLPLDHAPRPVGPPRCPPSVPVPAASAPREPISSAPVRLRPTVHAPDSVLFVDPRQRRLHVPVRNTDLRPISGLARVETGGAGRPTLIAAACFSVPEAGSAELEIPVGSTLTASAELLAGFTVRLVLQFTEEGASSRMARSYTLRSGRR